MARLIDADALLKDSDKREGAYGLIFSAEDIRNAPTIEAAPVKHGEWKYDEDVKALYCGCCGIFAQPQRKTNYCPHCGADMRGE